MNEKQALALQEFNRASELFSVLAEPTRQQIIVLLGIEHAGLNVKQITAEMRLSRPAVSHHLKELSRVGMIQATKKGTENIYQLKLTESLNQFEYLIDVIRESCKSAIAEEETL
ncbi:ArsR family transcriptional regulator [Periweissella cryptocerci]|uniref:ArsR family transcriptional regulator n=1 Tax=Periweissella cryptocerci TaxID=2506420 RepID=A0A4P6YW55_9LACO|nr:metalloregulator ArsR/SmtB family transcription factor [Periweissella cryptocerci]QBO37119.1 ArsR family transcriptional regulator [Periweissella cryptocerci]